MNEIVLNTVLVLSILTAVLFLIFSPKNKKLVNVFGSYIVLCGVFEIIAVFTATTNNMPYFHLFNLLVFTILAYFFILFFQLSKNWIIGLIIILCCFLVNLVFFHSIYEYEIWNKSIMDLLMIVASILALFKLFGEDGHHLKPIRFFIFGLLINLCGSFIIFLFFNVLSTLSETTYQNIYLVSVCLNLVAQLLYLAGILYMRVKATEINE